MEIYSWHNFCTEILELYSVESRDVLFVISSSRGVLVADSHIECGNIGSVMGCYGDSCPDGFYGQSIPNNALRLSVLYIVFPEGFRVRYVKSGGLPG